MSVQIIEVHPTGCCQPKEFVEAQRRTVGVSRPIGDDGWPATQFTYVYRCEICGQHWKCKYEPPAVTGSKYGYTRTERIGKTSRRYRKRLAKELLRQGTT